MKSSGEKQRARETQSAGDGGYNKNKKRSKFPVPSNVVIVMYTLPAKLFPWRLSVMFKYWRDHLCGSLRLSRCGWWESLRLRRKHVRDHLIFFLFARNGVNGMQEHSPIIAIRHPRIRHPNLFELMFCRKIHRYSEIVINVWESKRDSDKRQPTAMYSHCSPSIRRHHCFALSFLCSSRSRNSELGAARLSLARAVFCLLRSWLAYTHIRHTTNGARAISTLLNTRAKCYTCPSGTTKYN